MKTKKVLVSLTNMIYSVNGGRLKSYRVVYGDYSELEAEDYTTINNAETTEDVTNAKVTFSLLGDDFITVGTKNPIKINKKCISSIIPYEGEVPERWDLENWDMKEHIFMDAESSILVVE